MRLLLFFSVFSSTLFFDSYLGFQGLSLYLTLLFVFLVNFFSQKDPLPWREMDLLHVLFVLQVVFFSAIMCFIKNDMALAVLKPYIAIVVNIYIFITLYQLVISERQFILNMLRYIMLFNISIIVAQFVLWHLLKVDLNIGSLLGGSGHRQYGYNGDYRLTGIFDEPGIYGVFMFCLFVVKYIYFKRFEKIDCILCLTVLMTDSMYSFLLFFLFFIWKVIFNVKYNLINKVILAIFFIIASFIIMYLFLPRVSTVISGGDYSTFTKMILIDDYFSNPSLLFFSGVGLLPLDYWPNVGYQAMGDMTFIGSTFIIYGVPLGFILLINILHLISGGVFNKWTILSLIPLVKLTMLSWTFFWIYILLVSAALYKEKKIYD